MNTIYKSDFSKPLETLREETGITPDEIGDLLANNLIIDEDGFLTGHKQKTIHYKGITIKKVGSFSMNRQDMENARREHYIERRKRRLNRLLFLGFWITFALLTVNGIIVLFF